MKKLLRCVLILGTIFLVGIIYSPKAKGGEDIEQTIRQVAKDYRQEQGFQSACYVGGQEVSLGALMFGIGTMEGAFKEGSAGMRTNNVGSLRREMGLKKAIGTECIDSTCTRPVYETMYDGMYEKAYVIAHNYGCTFELADAMCYIYGCNAEWTDARVAHARGYLSNVKKQSSKFDNSKGEIVLSKPTGCVQVDWTEASYLQIDSKDGEFISSQKLPGELVKVFKCFE